ncbi:MAG: outer membrane beta-barrel protein [Flammeovirgaceae bacterium]|jgi:hypothetical protein|nr:outer membrane beta-barrel protein [Flammeovirgaceae bacterium]
MKGYGLLIFTLLMGTTCIGQGMWFFGAKGGTHLSSSYIEHSIYRVNLLSKPLRLYQSGLFIQYFPKRTNNGLQTGIRIGVDYIQKGWDQNYLDTLANVNSVRSRMDYLNIPIESILYRGSETSRVYILIGINFDFLMSHDVAKDPQDKDAKTDFWTYDPVRDKNYGYGLKGGLGFQRKMGLGQILFEAYFNYGLSNFIKTDDRALDIPDISNLWESGISVGYVIPFKR